MPKNENFYILSNMKKKETSRGLEIQLDNRVFPSHGFYSYLCTIKLKIIKNKTHNTKYEIVTQFHQGLI